QLLARNACIDHLRRDRGIEKPRAQSLSEAEAMACIETCGSHADRQCGLAVETRGLAQQFLPRVVKCAKRKPCQISDGHRGNPVRVSMPGSAIRLVADSA